MDNNMHILVVDDEAALRDTLAFNLEADGYKVTTAASAEEALALDLGNFDLLLLDIMMGDISGMQLAKILKSRTDTATLPVIFCTALCNDDSEVACLDLGAEDYITKPFSMKSIKARVRSVLRRRAEAGIDTSDDVRFKGLVMHPSCKRCFVDGKEVRLPRKEFEILLLLLQNRGRIFSRAELLNMIWPEEVVVLERVVDVNITRIRQKTGVYSANIVTRAGYGYGFIE